MVGVPEADVIEENDPVVVRERGPDVSPHGLIAAEAVREEHGLRVARPVLDDVGAGENAHALTVTANGGRAALSN
jgi:hypothetical protein